MFTVHCPRHGRQVLLDDDRILGIDRDAEGLRVRWLCWCGHSGSHCTGRPSPAGDDRLTSPAPGSHRRTSPR